MKQLSKTGKRIQSGSEQATADIDKDNCSAKHLLCLRLYLIYAEEKLLLSAIS